MQRSSLALSLVLGAALVLGGAGLYARRYAAPTAPAPATSSSSAAREAAPPRAPRPAPTQRQRPAPKRGAAEVLAALRVEKDPAARRALVNELADFPDAAGLLREVFHDSTDGAAREQALIAASTVGDAAAVAFLAEAGRDETYGARAGAALGAVNDAAAAPALAGLLASNAPVIVRANAARALGAAGTADQAPALAGLVGDAGQPLRVRQEAALALGQIGDPSVAPALAAALDQAAGDPAQDAVQLRISLVQALGGLGGDTAREALERHARRPLGAAERVFTQRALAAR